MRYPRSLALILTCFSACAVVGCGPRETQVERAVERALPRIVGPAESYRVDVQGIRGATGADLVTVRGERVRPAGSPVLDVVSVALADVVYNPNCTGLQRIGRIEGRVGVREADLESFLAENRNLQNVDVQLRPPNAAVVSAVLQIPQLELPPGVGAVEVIGVLHGAGPLINYEISQVRAGGVTLPNPAPRLLSERINPVVDLSSMPIAVQVGELRIDDSTLIADVTGRYMQPSANP